MATSGRNEGFRLLEEFTCEAVSDPASVSPGHQGRGVNPGTHLITELVSRASQPPVSAERVAQLRNLSSVQLLLLVREFASNLSSQELLVIHDIAAERLDDENPFFEGAIELSQETMLVAVNRSV